MIAAILLFIFGPPEIFTAVSAHRKLLDSKMNGFEIKHGGLYFIDKKEIRILRPGDRAFPSKELYRLQ